VFPPTITKKKKKKGKEKGIESQMKTIIEAPGKKMRSHTPHLSFCGTG
jgi:hypothetical protein